MNQRLERLISFKEMTFFLRVGERNECSVAGVRVSYKDSQLPYLFSCDQQLCKIPSQSDSELRTISSAKKTKLSTLASLFAVTRLLLKRTRNPLDFNESLKYLYDACCLQPLFHGTTCGEPIKGIFASKSELEPLAPFYLTRAAKKSRVLVRDEALVFLRSEHIHFVLLDLADLSSPTLSADIADNQLIELLIAGAKTEREFGANWGTFESWSNAPQSSGCDVPLQELGPILASYCQLIDLEPNTVADRLQNARESDQWPFENFNTRGELLQFLNEHFYRGGVQKSVPFASLTKLLAAHDDQDDTRDVPDLMAEWLTAAPTNKDYLKLTYSNFSTPNDRLHGTRTKYSNARYRIEGLEAAFVLFEIEGNTQSSKMKCKVEPIQSLSSLLRNFQTNEAKHVPHSNPHVHPGDELIFLLKGSVFIHLENTGVWTPVQQGDYIHYNSEIPHSVWNTANEPALALVVRFFQLARHGTRQRQIEVLSNIESLMASLSTSYSHDNMPRTHLLSRLKRDLTTFIDDSAKSYDLWTRIAPWVHDRTRAPKEPLRNVTKDTMVADLVGLSKFLNSYVANDEHVEKLGIALMGELRHAVAEFQSRLPFQDAYESGNSDALTDPASNISIMSRYKACLEAFVRANFDEHDFQAVLSCFEGIPRNSREVPAKILGEIAKVLRLPNVLLDGYLASPALRVVNIRGSNERNSRISDWVEPLQYSSGKGAQYYLPSRILANSDMLITLLHLNPSGVTDWNHHPGFEVIIPLEGTIYVEFKEPDRSSEECSTEGLLIYKSSLIHRVVSAGRTCEVLVLRFLVP